ncbi:MAG: methylthioribulose 1-phosphate dehydratase [Nevskiales bacterium]
MLKVGDFAQAVQDLAEAGRFFHSRGWVPATGGNFSTRLGPAEIAITASGRHKGELGAADVTRCDLSGRSLISGVTVSYETPLHTTLYRRDAAIGAVLHVHSVPNTVLSLTRPQGVQLTGYELLKVLPAISSHDAAIIVPVFANDQDVPRLAQAVEVHLAAHADAAPAYLIAGHGLYTWAPNLRQCRWQVEALEFMFECELRR